MPGTSGKDPTSSQSQMTISSFFSKGFPAGKRASSPIDLTVDDDEQRPRKKPKRGSSHGKSSDLRGDAGTSRSAAAAEQWRYTPSSPEKRTTESHANDSERRKRREEFKRKLLGENSIFLRPAASTRPEDSAGEETDTLEDRSDDHAFKELSEMFSNKSKRKGIPTRTTGSSTTTKRKAVEEIGPSGETYTPLEKQVLQTKKDNPGTLLLFEVGYKYIFYGEDAQIASKELGIVCFPKRNFLTAMIPIHRRGVHVKNLLSQGYKVGIVEQIETAALKKISDSKNAPFERKLTHLYTAATYVDELNSVDDIEAYTPPPLMCLVEEVKGGMGVDERVCIGMVVISASTGDIIWDEFDDAHMRTELETRLVHTKPYELLLPEDGLTKLTERMLTHFTTSPTSQHKTRIERFDSLMSYTESFSFVSNFYDNKVKSRDAPGNANADAVLASVTGFPKPVVVALAHAIKYLSAFHVADAFLETRFFTKFTSRTHMLLNGNTLTNLEIFRNDTDYTTKGSLIWILDHTKTKFGARMLKSWVGRPLTDASVLRERIDAVEEIISSTSEKLVTLRELLKHTPDLARGLCRIQYGKCTPQELAVLLPAFNRIGVAFPAMDTPHDVGFKSPLLNEIIFSFILLRKPIQNIMEAVSLKSAKEGRKDIMWIDPDKYPEIAKLDLEIQTVKVALNEELKSVRKLLKMPSLTWQSVAGEEYLVELKKSQNKDIPLTWILISKTKYLERYRTPAVKRLIEKLAQFQELLDAEAHRSFLSFLDEICQTSYAFLRDAINKLATADCLLSFALVALQDGYVRPEFTDDDTLEIVEGRHPMVEALRSDPFVPNTICMGGENPKSKVITGPNMGGKSSSVRMVALIAVMAQVGSYVPAASVKLGMLDGILTRMGASDDLARGRSTFMVEMSETSDILHTATKNSLVILDELGRGTSTFDGMAIADATLQHLVQNVKCKTLFITHYPLVAMDLEKKFPLEVQNLHMGFTEESRINGTRTITFLYRLTNGLATESFGIECARIADLPATILNVAAERSSAMKIMVESRLRQTRARKFARLLNSCLSDSEDRSLRSAEELRELTESV